MSHSLLFIMVREELFCGNTFNNSVTFWSFMSLALFLGAWINQIWLSLFNPSTSPTASVECLVQTGKYATVVWWNLEAFRFREDLMPLVLPVQSQEPAWYHVPAHWKRVVLWWVCFLLQEEQGSLSTRCFNCRSKTTHHCDSPHFLILISGLQGGVCFWCSLKHNSLSWFRWNKSVGFFCLPGSRQYFDYTNLHHIY